ncbi:hypothetical protein BCR34DRAFT_568276 [Clohesyomyces aquaticus]|uniref:Caspase domain-domain-containing protein n=1 Tax=Clohesyomyces aquaticus TaxID=1231657 RepID=A0A1Y1ZGX6_9PLEO|nr:hypothetical protein BCR34DRAFT_568276 [Clohesyomyces aquaticus]
METSVRLTIHNMAAQRHFTGRPTPTGIMSLSPESSHTSTEISRKDPAILLEDKPLFQPGDEDAKRALQLESSRQSWFQKKANDSLNIPNGYLKVAVLLIRWDDGIDEFKDGHNQEIRNLRDLFKDRFHYDCEIAKLENCRNPQVDLNCEILQHIRKHDGPNNLLVIYYTGHGRILQEHDGSRLELLGTRKSEQNQDTHEPIAFWDAAEAPLKDLAEGDVLSILDCCFASSAAMKGRAEEVRTYQLLAASTAEGYTPQPGRNSFTAALIESLKELLDDNADQNFSVTKLVENINRKRRKHPSFVWDRLKRYRRNVNLAPLDTRPYHERIGPFQDGEPEKASLSIRFSLKDNDLSREQIEDLAKYLPQACKKSKVPVRQIDWVKMEESVRRPSRSLRGVGTFIIAGGKLRRMSSTRGGQQSDVSPASLQFQKKRPSLQSESSLSPSKRRSSSSDRILRSATLTPVSPRSSGTVDDETSSSG